MKKLFFLGALFGILLLSIGFVSADRLAYDENKNLITGDGFFREYNSFNNLVTVRAGNSPSGVIIEKLEWHPIESRVLIKHVYNTSGAWVETVTYISENFVHVKNASGEFDTTYITQNGQIVAQKNDDGSKSFVHADHSGSIGLVTDESGSVVEETVYSPFGEIISGGETSLYDYEGKEFDSVTDDYDYGARRYNPGWGIFLQPDPIIQNIYDPQTLNHYAFERNNPYLYIDLTGKDFRIYLNRDAARGHGHYSIGIDNPDFPGGEIIFENPGVIPGSEDSTGIEGLAGVTGVYGYEKVVYDDNGEIVLPAGYTDVISVEQGADLDKVMIDKGMELLEGDLGDGLSIYIVQLEDSETFSLEIVESGGYGPFKNHLSPSNTFDNELRSYFRGRQGYNIALEFMRSDSSLTPYEAYQKYLKYANFENKRRNNE